MQKDTVNLNHGKSQKDIVSSLKINDESTLKELYQTNYFKIEKFVLNNNGSQEQAKDIYQEAFIVMWSNVKDDKFIPQNATSLEGYLYQIAKNKWMDYLRSAHYKKTVPMMQSVDKNAQSDVAAGLYQEEEEDKVSQAMKAFEGLEERCKKLLSQFYFEKKSLKTIAKEMALDPASAKNKKYRCMQALRALVQTK